MNHTIHFESKTPGFLVYIPCVQCERTLFKLTEVCEKANSNSESKFTISIREMIIPKKKKPCFLFEIKYITNLESLYDIVNILGNLLTQIYPKGKIMVGSPSTEQYPETVNGRKRPWY